PAFFALEQGSQDSSHQMDTGAGVADLSAGHQRDPIDLARRRGGAARAPRDVLIDPAVFERTWPEPLHGGINHAGIDLLNSFPRESHAVDGAGRVVLHHDVAEFDELREYFLAQ